MSDPIDRQAAVSRISDLLMLELEGRRLPTWDEVNEAINELPSAQTDVPERNVGKWEVYYDDDDPQDGIWKCSSCGYIRFVDDSSPTNYCPHCGADMRKEAEDGEIY